MRLAVLLYVACMISLIGANIWGCTLYTVQGAYCTGVGGWEGRELRNVWSQVMGGRIKRILQQTRYTPGWRPGNQPVHHGFFLIQLAFIVFDKVLFLFWHFKINGCIKSLLDNNCICYFPMLFVLFCRILVCTYLVMCALAAHKMRSSFTM